MLLYTYECMYIHMHQVKYNYICLNMPINVHIYMHTYMYTYIYIYTCGFTCIYLHIHMCLHINIDTYIQIYMQAFDPSTTDTLGVEASSLMTTSSARGVSGHTARRMLSDIFLKTNVSSFAFSFMR